MGEGNIFQLNSLSHFVLFRSENPHGFKDFYLYSNILANR
jgi:hypothetical protein